MKKILTAAAVALLATAAPAFATETITAPFTTAAGGTSTGNYFGLINVTVTGTGQSNGTAFNDAFYSLTGAHDANYYQLTFGTSPLVGYKPSQDAFKFIVGGLPAYSDTHSYTFQLNTGLAQSAAGLLYFGVSDGIFKDNSGSYAVTISQSAVPEPATWAMMLMGFGMIGLGLRSYQRKSTKVTYA